MVQVFLSVHCIYYTTHFSVRRIRGRLDVLRRAVGGKSEQRAFFIPTQPCFDFTLGFVCTQSSQNSAQSM
jgi:hypothetical protein